MKLNLWQFGALACALCASVAPASATPPRINNNVPDVPEWVELPVAAPPTFSRDKLISISMPADFSMAVGVDPNTITVGTDGVVRYVVVMTNRSGGFNAFFEGIHCITHEVKTYAYHTSSSDWVFLNQPAWHDLNDTMPSHHAMAFARDGACQFGGPPTRDEILDVLKNGPRPLSKSLGN